jgi:proteic killer suppression protein
MIVSFASKETEKIFNLEFSAKLPIDIQRVALKKLTMFDASNDLRNLIVFKGTD